jgi:glycosyltransferase involved in cell wall biosynthesis
MKRLKVNSKLAQKYNHPETLVVVSLYPKKGEFYSAGLSGVAAYTKNVVVNMNRQVVVLADYQKEPSVYEEKNSLVLRCFQPGRLQMWKEILHVLRWFSHSKKVLIQFDFSMYGNMVVSGSILFFSAMLKLLGFEVSVVSHHVILDVNKLSGHVGLGNGFVDKIKAKIYNVFFYLFYLLLGLVTYKTIILEETLRERLEKVIPTHKIVAIPLAVDPTLHAMDKSKARKKLGIKSTEKVVLFFGFVNWFKGADFFATAFQDVKNLLGKPARFIIAGGESATLSTKPYYQKYFFDMLKTIENSHAVQITGYVSQEKIKEYFSAADLVVFPYRHFMCASGVLSLVFSYKKPFIVSEALGDMFEAEDLKEALVASHLQKKDLTFALDKTHLIQRTEKVLRNGLKKKMITMAGIVRQQRSYRNNAMLYDQALFAPETVKTQDLLLEYS